MRGIGQCGWGSQFRTSKMNLIQIANGMGTSMRFGDLPKYSYVITKINDILPDDLTITATTTGVEFLTIYNGLKPDKQNLLASVIEHDQEIRLEIVSDIAMNELSKRSRERTTFAQNARLMFIITLILVATNLYIAFSYHQHAVALLGADYESTVVGALRYLFDFIDQVLKSSGTQ